DGEVTVYDEHGNEVPSGQDMDIYYVGKVRNFKELTRITEIVTELVYTLAV
ncbi:UNVERIFIED_CONTAM: N-acetyltransferase, partial [Lactobacillus acidophilus]|nr:N-acetyltransferase [Lactobacillus acidophilus]